MPGKEEKRYSECEMNGLPSVTAVKNPSASEGDARDGFDFCVGNFPWKRKWQPRPVFLPGKFRGQRSPWLQSLGCKDSDTTWVTNRADNKMPAFFRAFKTLISGPFPPRKDVYYFSDIPFTLQSTHTHHDSSPPASILKSDSKSCLLSFDLWVISLDPVCSFRSRKAIWPGSGKWFHSSPNLHSVLHKPGPWCPAWERMRVLVLLFK